MDFLCISIVYLLEIEIYKVFINLKVVSNMKNKLYSLLFLLLFALPFPFISMYLDFKYGTMLGYLIMIAVYVALTYGCRRINNHKVYLYGNGISVVVSLIFMQSVTYESWSYYFTPLSPVQLLFFIAILAGVLQLSAGYFINKNLEK